MLLTGFGNLPLKGDHDVRSHKNYIYIKLLPNHANAFFVPYPRDSNIYYHDYIQKNAENYSISVI